MTQSYNIVKISRPSVLCSFALGGVLLSASVQGAVIFSEGFESTGVADGDFTSDWSGPNGSAFTVSSLDGNLLNPTGTGNVWLDPVPPALGEIFAVLHKGGTATGNTGQTFTAGMDYTFTFTHFRRDDIDGDAVRASIGNTTVPLASVDFAAVTTTGTFETRTVSYTAAAADDGQAIVLRFFDFNGGGNTTNQTGIDNIELTAVPEPSAALLGALGLLALLRRRR